ncbi:MAG: small basic protein [Puniceicoccales bacterium]|nr:small basic protein [Puniceicoccales bacterium]
MPFSGVRLEGKEMTQHPSFTRSGSGAANKRSVLKRYERVDLLKKRGVWSEKSSIVGLPKTKPEE